MPIDGRSEIASPRNAAESVIGVVRIFIGVELTEGGRMVEGLHVGSPFCVAPVGSVKSSVPMCSPSFR